MKYALNKVYEYCMMLKLSVNTTRTKTIVFFTGNVRRIPNFHYGCDIVEAVSEYIYPGVTMNINNKFEKAIRKQLDQGRKSQCSLLVKAKKLELPIVIECNLFEKLVFPVMLYGELNLRICWKYFTGNYKNIHLRCMVYAEVGKLPLQLTIDKRFA